MVYISFHPFSFFDSISSYFSFNVWTFCFSGAAPFEALNVGDVGDLNICPYEIQRAAADIREGYSKVISNGCKALAIGGDHTITYPILQAIKVFSYCGPYWRQKLEIQLLDKTKYSLIINELETGPTLFIYNQHCGEWWPGALGLVLSVHHRLHTGQLSDKIGLPRCIVVYLLI